jgi:hypothetical protein
MTRARPALALAGLILLQGGPSVLAAPPAERPQTTPLEEAHLFIAPSGEPFRSASGQPYPVVQWFKRADSNGDGKLDKAEFRADASTFFHVLDRNGDGVVTDPEIAYYEKVTVPELNESATGVDNNPTDDRTKLSKDLQGAAPYSLINDAEPVRSADDSLIGRLTLKSYLKRADHNFDVLDDAGRGYLTLEGLPRTQVQTAATPVRGAKAR